MEVDWGFYQLCAYGMDARRVLQKLEPLEADACFVRKALDLIRTYLTAPRAHGAAACIQSEVDASMVRLVWNLHSDANRHGFWHEICVIWEQMRPIARGLPDVTGFAEITRQLAIIRNNRGESREAQQLYEELLSLPEFDELLPNQQADVLHQMGVCYRTQGDYRRAEQVLIRCIQMAQQNADQQDAGSTDAYIQARYHDVPHKRRNAAARIWQSQAFALNQLGHIALSKGKFARAREYYTRCWDMFVAHGEEENLACIAYMGLGMLLVEEQRFAEARSFLQRNLQIRRRIGDEGIAARAAIHLAAAHIGCGHSEQAESLLSDAFRVSKALDDREHIAHCHLLYGYLDAQHERPEAALAEWQTVRTMLHDGLAPLLLRKASAAQQLQYLRLGQIQASLSALNALLNSLASANLLPHGAHVGSARVGNWRE